MTRRAHISVAGALALAFLTFVAAGSAGRTFTDTRADNTLGLDVTSVSLSEDPAGALIVAVAVANAPTLPPGTRVDLWLDLDSNQRTGDEGDEALARYTAEGALVFSRWNGNRLVQRPAAGVTAAWAAGTLTYTLPKPAIDGDSSFGVLVVTRGYRETGDEDDVYSFDAIPELGRLAYASPGPSSFSDPTGDLPTVPDVTKVDVSDKKDGMLRFAVTTPSHRTLPGDVELMLAIDRDLSDGSGPVDRAEVLLSYENGRLSVWRWDRDEYEWVKRGKPHARAGSLGNGVTVFEVHRSELLDVARFGLNVVSSVEDEDGDYAGYDVAPDESSWRYTLAHRPPLRLIAGTVAGEPSRPRAGRPFTIAVPIARSDTARALTSAKVACTVAAGGRTLATAGKIEKGRAVCTVRVPRTAVALHGSMVVRALGKSVRVWFAGGIEFGGGVDG